MSGQWLGHRDLCPSQWGKPCDCPCSDSDCPGVDLCGCSVAALLEPEDTCRTVEVDGEAIRVHGDGEMDETDLQHFTEIVRAAKRRYEAEDRP